MHGDRYEAGQQRAGRSALVLPKAQVSGLGIAALTQELPSDPVGSARAACRPAFDFHEAVTRKFGCLAATWAWPGALNATACKS